MTACLLLAVNCQLFTSAAVLLRYCSQKQSRYFFSYIFFTDKSPQKNLFPLCFIQLNLCFACFCSISFYAGVLLTSQSQHIELFVIFKLKVSYKVYYTCGHSLATQIKCKQIELQCPSQPLYSKQWGNIQTAALSYVIFSQLIIYKYLIVYWEM